MLLAPPSPARHAFEPVNDDVAFRLQSGGLARSLDELAARLQEAPAGVAWYHREHLPPWVRDVVGDASLARRLEDLAATPDADAYRDAALGVLRTRLEAARAHRPGA